MAFTWALFLNGKSLLFSQTNTGTQYISEYMWNCAPTLLFYYHALLSQLIHWSNTAIWWLPRGQYLLWSDRMLYLGSSCHHICDTAGMNVFKHNIYTRKNALHVFLFGSFAQRPKLTTKPTLPIKSASERGLYNTTFHWTTSDWSEVLRIYTSTFIVQCSAKTYWHC